VQRSTQNKQNNLLSATDQTANQSTKLFGPISNKWSKYFDIRPHRRCRQTVQSYSTRGHICATCRTRLKLCLLRPTWVHKWNGKSIGSAVFAQFMSECRRACRGIPFPLEISPSHGGSVPPSNTWFLRFNRLSFPNGILISQPFFHSSWQKVPIGLLYNMGAPFHQNCPFWWGILTPSDKWLPGSIQAHSQNGISLGSAIFAQVTAECPYTLQWDAPSPLKIVSSHGGSGPPSNTWLPGPTRVLNPNGISIGSAVLQGSLLWQTDRPTDHTTRVNNNRPHLRT